ncbi:MerR family transcriptional regulator [Chelativorans alearense]|uniref:MerR family transcriptional regulator n=1 Tax=Chelativorans alearense TaxID=2681495 RepID=UPI0013D2DF48|nr:helix-turn-helix domain-containing protein [Chelativorans alearense]
MPALKIGDLAERTGTNTPTIRYYEEIGLLPRADRQDGGQRRYDDEDVKRLTLIRRCREFGFSIEQVRSLTALVEDPNRSCLEARDLAQEHLMAVRAKLCELRALERSMESFIASCETVCAGGPGPECTILQDLAKPTVGAKAAAARMKHGRSPRRVRGS